HRNGLTQVQVGQRGGHEGGQHGGAGGHANAQGNVALSQEGHHVGGGAAGAGAHQHHANSQLGGQVEQLDEQERQEGHNRELGHAADQNVLWAGEHHLEVIQLEGQAHAEHNHHQQVVHGDQTGYHVPVLAHPQKALGYKEGQ